MEQKGIFVQNLSRNNSQIRADRAQAICESTQILYKRTVEDLILEKRSLELKRASALDLSPGETTSLKPKAFDENTFVNEDLKYGAKIENLALRIELAKERYEELFGERFVEPVTIDFSLGENE